MTIHLPKDVESSINAAVLSGHFASPDDAITAAWRAFLRQRTQEPPGKAVTLAELHQQMLADGLLSQLPDAAEDIDEEEDAPIAVEGEPLSETIIRERRVRRLTRRGNPAPIYLAGITAVEVTSAVALRRGTGAGRIAPPRVRNILTRFRGHLAGRYLILEITLALLSATMRLADHHAA